METFSVIVANVGTVLYTDSEEEARERFELERFRSRMEDGWRGYGEDVSLHGPDGELLELYSVPERWTEEDTPPPSVLEAISGRYSVGEVYTLDADEGDGSAWWSALEGPLSDVSEDALLRRMRAGELLVLVPASGSDYSGGALARANVQALRELAEDEGLEHFTLSGGHGTHGIAFPLWERSRALADALEKLDSYPVVDEDLWSQLEHEDEEEAWECWLRGDFERALESAHGVDVDESTDEELRSHFRETMERAGVYFEHTDEGPSIDVDALAQHSTREELLELSGAVSTTADEEERAARILRTMRETVDALDAPTLAEDFRGDRLPVLHALEGFLSRLEPLGVVDALEGPVSDALSVLRQVGQWPALDPADVSAEDPGSEELARELERLAESVRARTATGSDLEALARAVRSGEGYRAHLTVRGRLAHVLETVERVRSAARESVLPALRAGLESVGESGRERVEELARTWGRSLESGLPLAEHFRRETESAWAADRRARFGDAARRRTLLLPRFAEELLEPLRESGASPADAARAIVLEEVARSLEGQRWTLVSVEGRSPRADVVAVDRERGTVALRLSDGGEELERPLSDFLHHAR